MSAAAKVNVVHLPSPRRPQARQWDAAKHSPLTNAWDSWSRPIDLDIRTGLTTMRARARELAQNNDHAKGFLRIVRNNIVGAPGFVLQSRAMLANGKPDKRLRAEIEREWKVWGRRGHCEVSGKFSWKTLQRHVIETVARDGEAFLRIIRGPINRWEYALQVIDPESVDISYNGETTDPITGQRNEIRMGVEIDAWRRPVAYWLFTEPKINQGSYQRGERVRVPARDMIHVYLPEFALQTRGVPWLAVAAQRAHMIQGTEDAEVTASRASASKFGVYEAAEWSPQPTEATAANGQQLVDEYGQPLSTDPGRFVQDFEPGMQEVVPYGYSYKLLDPQHPNPHMPDFLKWGLRSMATGWGVSYNTLGNDAEGVNYTSLRFFLGVERDNWTEQQDWFEGDLPEPVVTGWANAAYAAGALNPRPNQLGQLHVHTWQPRRWEGPDPAKQAQADRDELENGTTTHTAILARKGIDLDDFLEERVTELERMREAAERAGLGLEQFLPYLSDAVASRPARQPDPDNA